MGSLADITKSEPCDSRCPICKTRCYGSKGHSYMATAGRKSLAELHQCPSHCWGTLAELRQTLMANEKATRAEALEEISRTHRPINARTKQWEQQRAEERKAAAAV